MNMKKDQYIVGAIYWLIVITLLAFASHHYVVYCNLTWLELACMDGAYLAAFGFGWHHIKKLFEDD